MNDLKSIDPFRPDIIPVIINLLHKSCNNIKNMRITSRLLLSLLFAGLYLSLATPALAARNYLVELVIFSTQGSTGNEIWTRQYPPLNARKMSRAIMPGHGDLKLNNNLAEVRNSNFSSIVDRINRDPGRRTILSTRWIQPVLSPANTSIAHITDRRNPTSLQNTNYNKNKTGYTGNQIATAPPLLDGFINFFLDGQYTLEADIRYTPPHRPSILDEEYQEGPITYRVYEKRRIKSGELNYYDHPKFGMVLLVTPVNIPTE
jgi:hypothetical protein